MVMHSTTVTFGGYPCISPKSLLDYCRRTGKPTKFWYGLANSYYCPRGVEPGRGYILMRQADKAKLPGGYMALRMFDGTQSIVAQCSITRYTTLFASLDDANNITDDTIYLIEVQDKRFNYTYFPSKHGTFTKSYNIYLPYARMKDGATDTTDQAYNYYPSTLNSGSLWTWTTIFNDVWPEGSPPSIPAEAPTGNIPFCIKFFGANRMRVIGTLLNHLGCELVFNPTTDSFSIVDGKATQAESDSLLSDYSGRVLSVRNNFTRLSTGRSVHLSIAERSTGRDMAGDFYHDSYQSGTSNEINKEVMGVHEGKMPIWESVPAWYDRKDDYGSNQDEADIGSQHSSRKELSYISATISGIALIYPGSQIGAVLWRDYGDSQGMVTEVLAPGDNIVWERSDYLFNEVNSYVSWGQLQQNCGGNAYRGYLPSPENEPFMPPIARPHYHTPPVTKVVCIYDSGKSDGEPVKVSDKTAPNGLVIAMDETGTVGTDESSGGAVKCHILFTDPDIYVPNKEPFIATWIDTNIYTIDGHDRAVPVFFTEYRPLWRIKKDGTTLKMAYPPRATEFTVTGPTAESFVRAMLDQDAALVIGNRIICVSDTQVYTGGGSVIKYISIGAGLTSSYDGTTKTLTIDHP